MISITLIIYHWVLVTCHFTLLTPLLFFAIINQYHIHLIAIHVAQAVLLARLMSATSQVAKQKPELSHYKIKQSLQKIYSVPCRHHGLIARLTMLLRYNKQSNASTVTLYGDPVHTLTPSLLPLLLSLSLHMQPYHTCHQSYLIHVIYATTAIATCTWRTSFNWTAV